MLTRLPFLARAGRRRQELRLARAGEAYWRARAIAWQAEFERAADRAAEAATEQVDDGPSPEWVKAAAWLEQLEAGDHADLSIGEAGAMMWVLDQILDGTTGLRLPVHATESCPTCEEQSA